MNGDARDDAARDTIRGRGSLLPARERQPVL